MTEESVKDFMKSYPQLKAKKDVMDRIEELAPDENDQEEHANLKIKLQIIESALQVLTKDERDIVMLHLIENVKWTEIAARYEEQLGTELNYSDRTFKRIQKNALAKIEEFITKNQFEKYIE